MYQGDYAVILPDNSRNILYQGQQLMEITKQRQAAAAAQAKADAEREDAYMKLVGEKFDPSKHTAGSVYDPEVTQRIADAQGKYLEYLRQQKAAGKKVDESYLRQGIAQDVAGIKQDDDFAKAKQKEILDAVEAMKGPGVDDKKLAGLALSEYFNHTNPENGQRSMDPSKWNRDASGADVVANIAAKHFGIVGNNKGVDESIAETMAKDNKVKIDNPTITDPKSGQVQKVGYKAELNSHQQIKYDKNGDPVGVDIRQEPVLLPNGKPLLNVDGTPKTTVAKDLEEKYLARPGFALSVKKELSDKVGEENQRRKMFADATGLPFMPITNEEADIIKSDIVLDKLRKNMPPTPINKDDVGQKQFENQMALKRLQLQQQDNFLASEKFKFDKAKQNKETPEITPLTISIAEARGVDIPNHEGGVTRVVYTKDIGQKENDIIAGQLIQEDKKGVKTVEPIVWPFKTNNGNTYYEALPNGDWKGQTKDGKEKIIPKEQVADEQLKYYTKDDLPLSTKGQRPKFMDRVKTAVQNVKIALTKKRTYSVINPTTGEVVMAGVDEAAAKKAEAKGYKTYGKD